MKYGVNIFLWTSVFGRAELNLIPRAKKLGFDGIEFPTDLTILGNKENMIEAVKAALEENNLGCTLSTGVSKEQNLVSSDSSVRKKAINHVTSLIKIANKLGSRILAGTFYAYVGEKPRNPRAEEEWDLLVKGVKELSKVAEDYNVLLALEALNRYETNILNTVEDTVKLIEEVGSSNVGVHLDVFHMNIEEKDLYRAIRNAGKHLAHIHVNENNRGFPGAGSIDWKRISKGLKEVSYDGWITLEVYVPEVKELVSDCCIWRDPLAGTGKSRDEAAKESLEFLKQILG